MKIKQYLKHSLDGYFFASLNQILPRFLQLFRCDVNSFQSFFKRDFTVQSDTANDRKNASKTFEQKNSSIDTIEKLNQFDGINSNVNIWEN